VASREAERQVAVGSPSPTAVLEAGRAEAAAAALQVEAAREASPAWEAWEAQGGVREMEAEREVWGAQREVWEAEREAQAAGVQQAAEEQRASP
jgi:hypothetical protein